MSQPVDLRVSVAVDAPPEVVWALVADITRMGEWSPETVSAWWLGGASSPVVGARFKGRNRRGPMIWATTCEITAADPGQRFGFVRISRIDHGTDWTFTTESKDGGTLLTESARQRRLPGSAARLAGRLTFGPDREADIEKGMRTTVERIKQAAEGGQQVPVGG